MKIEILSVKFDVIELERTDWTSHEIGKSSLRDSRILLDPKTSIELQGQTLLHEVVHMIVGMNDLERMRDDEALISSISNSLFDFMKRNPDAIDKYIYGRSNQSG